MNKVQVKHCGPRPHRGETLTANYLRHHLPAGKILVNYYLPVYHSTREIDLVVLTHSGVYLLEVKHWTGAIKADQKTWRHRGENRPNPIPTIQNKAKIMHSFLERRNWHNVSVLGLVVLSKGREALGVHGSIRDEVLEEKVRQEIDENVFGLHSSLVDVLTSRKFHPDRRTLQNTELNELCDTIFTAHVNDVERQIHGYHILKEQDRGHYVELIGETEFSDKVRIKQYDVPYVGSERELDRAIDRFRRDMDALKAAGRHINLLMPYRFRRDENSDERHYLILEWTGDQTLADRLAAGPIELSEQKRILADIADGLAHCHQRGIYHRNLSPSSVYLTPQGRAVVGDFDFARVPTVSRTLSTQSKSLIVGRHVAPEQLMQLPEIDQRADVFSLGVIWYDMVFRPAEDDAVERERIATAPLPDYDKDVMRMMLTTSHLERIQSMQEVQQYLDS